MGATLSSSSHEEEDAAKVPAADDNDDEPSTKRPRISVEDENMGDSSSNKNTGSDSSSNNDNTSTVDNESSSAYSNGVARMNINDNSSSAVDPGVLDRGSAGDRGVGASSSSESRSSIDNDNMDDSPEELLQNLTQSAVDVQLKIKHLERMEQSHGYITQLLHRNIEEFSGKSTFMELFQFRIAEECSSSVCDIIESAWLSKTQKRAIKKKDVLENLSTRTQVMLSTVFFNDKERECFCFDDNVRGLDATLFALHGMTRDQTNIPQCNMDFRKKVLKEAIVRVEIHKNGRWSPSQSRLVVDASAARLAFEQVSDMVNTNTAAAATPKAKRRRRNRKQDRQHRKHQQWKQGNQQRSRQQRNRCRL